MFEISLKYARIWFEISAWFKLDLSFGSAQDSHSEVGVVSGVSEAGVRERGWGSQPARCAPTPTILSEIWLICQPFHKTRQILWTI
jgi:hypothetical protein